MRTTRLIALVALCISLVPSLSACAHEPATSGGTQRPVGSENEPSLRGQIAGAGASSQAAAMQAWIATFSQHHPDAMINYDPVGSGGGREQFIEGAVQFAASDAPLNATEIAKLPEHCTDFIQVPGYISPIAVAFNIEGVKELSLSPATIAKLFAGQITRWNDPAIKAENPGVSLPDIHVNPVHRSDGSGSTETFTEYLHDTAPEVWTFGASKHWPEELLGEAAQQTSGVVQTIGAGNGSIGYADASQIGDLASVRVKVGDDYVAYSAQASARVVEHSPRVAQPASPYDYHITLDRNVEGGYPIVLVTYQLACPAYSTDQERDLVKAFYTYVLSEDGQAIAAQAAGSAPISPTLRTQAMDGIGQITTRSS